MKTMDPGIAQKLYEQYGFLIYGRCIRILRSEEDARDAVQEVFLKLLERYDTIREKDKTVSWIFSAATNYCFNILRQRKRHIREIPGDKVADRVRDHDERMSDQEIIYKIMSIHNRKVREAVYYTYEEELDQASIQKITGQSPATIRRNLARFKQSLPPLRKRLGIQWALMLLTI